MAAKMTARERAEAARIASEENLKRQLKRQRMQTIVISVIVALVVGGAVWVTWYLISGTGTDSQREANDVVVYDSGETTIPSVVEASDGGILIDMNGVAGGSAVPADAVRVDVYVDMLCPFCAVFEEVNYADLKALREEGVIELHVHPISILDRLSDGGFYPTRSAAAVYTVAEYSPEHADAFMQALFVAQPPENTKGLTNLEIANVALSAGVPADVVTRFADGEFTRYVAVATEQSSIEGVRGTPTVFLGGVEYSGALNAPGQLAADIAALAAAEAGAAAE